MNWKVEFESMNGSLDWVMCRLLVCVPQDFLELASNAVLGSRKRILQDPLLEGSASVEVCSYPEQGIAGSLTGSATTGSSRVARIAEALINSARLPEVNNAPGLVFCLLIVDRHLEARKLIADLTMDDETFRYTNTFRSFHRSRCLRTQHAGFFGYFDDAAEA